MRTRMIAICALAAVSLAGCSTVVPRRPGEAESIYGSVTVQLRAAMDSTLGPLVWDDPVGGSHPVRDDGRCLLDVGTESAAISAPPSDKTEIAQLLGAVNGVLSRNHFTPQKGFSVDEDGELSLESEDAQGAEVYVKAGTLVSINLRVPARPGECHE